jgi:hypothetical protein
MLREAAAAAAETVGREVRVPGTLASERVEQVVIRVQTTMVEEVVLVEVKDPW